MTSLEMPFTIYRQFRKYACGHNSMRMIISYVTGAKCSEKALVDAGHAAERDLRSIEGNGKKKVNEGIGSTGLIAIKNNYFERGFISAKGSREMIDYFLSNDIPVLVNWQSVKRDSGHFSVATSLYDDRITLADPVDGEGGILDLSYDFFEKWWWDPTPKYNHWMAAFFNRKLEIPFRGRKI
ncbi:MAG: hypothetical protein JW754_03640 [Candidatus Aenigmarchaeota archaeon]|nr:hypothetical protein [Candidatus Aenigmarchaeota archaeon]